MELRHLRYFVAVGEEQHYGRGAQRLRVAQPALSRQIQDLEDELGFKLFERLPRGVKISVAGKSFLEDARRILREVNEATLRAGRAARGQSGTLRVGFTESASWHGVVPGSFRQFRQQQPDAELQLNPSSSSEQIEALEKLRKLRLRDLGDTPFVWFPRRESPAFYDRLMHECFRAGLKSPRIVQEGVNEATILSLVLHGVGVGFVNENARWRRPEGVVVLPVMDLKLPLPLALVWRKDNSSPLLAKFVADVRLLPEVVAFARR